MIKRFLSGLRRRGKRHEATYTVSFPWGARAAERELVDLDAYLRAWQRQPERRGLGVHIRRSRLWDIELARGIAELVDSGRSQLGEALKDLLVRGRVR